MPALKLSTEIGQPHNARRRCAGLLFQSMIGSIPSYVDQAHALSDDSLYPQQLANMYSAPRFQQHRGHYPPQQQARPAYDAYDNTHNVYSQPMAESDFHHASFSDVGAAFGFNPDLPIQISAPQLPQSPTALIPGFNAPPYATVAPMFGAAVPMGGGDAYAMQGQGWAGGSHRAPGEDSEDEDMQPHTERRLPRL